MNEYGLPIIYRKKTIILFQYFFFFNVVLQVLKNQQSSQGINQNSSQATVYRPFLVFEGKVKGKTKPLKLKFSPNQLESLIKIEREKTETFFADPTINKTYQEYYTVSTQRKDSRHQELPERYDDYEYYSKFAYFDTGNDYQIIERKKNDDTTEVILDLRTISQIRKHQSTLKLTKIQLSDDHKMLAFGIDQYNDENQIWFIKHATGELLRDKLIDCCNAKFTKDGKNLLYLKYDDKFRPSSVLLHKLGTRQEEDTLVFEEKDENYYLDLQLTKDKEYFIILCSSKSANEIIAIDRNEPQIALQIIYPRTKQAIAYCSHHEKGFYFLTNQDVYDFKIQFQPNQQTELQDFYKPQDGEVLQEIDLFHENLVLYLKKEGASYLKIIELATSKTSVLSIPSSLVYTDLSKLKPSIFKKIYNRMISKEEKLEQPSTEQIAATISPGMNENYKTNVFRFHLDTPLVYNQVCILQNNLLFQVFEFDFLSKQLTRLQDSKLTGREFKRENYTCSRIYAPSQDGTLIPITLIHKKGMQKNRQNKVLMHSYGAYGIAQDVPFNVVYLSALDQGWVIAYAHIRGGNERGQEWHKAAIKQNKIKSVEDLIACAAHLISTGITHPALLCGFGASAGATILGAAVNMRPDIWKSVVLSAPFLDILGQ